jgi:hypothetical protein
MLRSGRNKLSVSLLAMTALVLPASAHAAGVLYTSPLWADSGSSYHACNVANIFTQAVTLKVQMFNSSGVVIATSGATDITITAGHTYELSQGTYTGFAYCQFSLPSETGIVVRANLSVFHSTGTFFETLALSEAR